MTKKFVTKTIFKKIQAHIVRKIFVTKTISYKILLYLVTKFSSLKQFFVVIFVTKKFITKTNFLFLFFFMALILTCNLSLHYSNLIFEKYIYFNNTFIKKDPYIPQIKNKTSIQFKLLPYKYTIIVCNTYNNSRCFIIIQKV